jgi:uncharacterized protein YjbI with pentapeptide repeats|tara:strand:+ start:413 stop:562 length:150 start_codon:yes stop_codon:yes gene_type:complete
MNCNLQGVDLSGAGLGLADLSGANLENTDPCMATLYNTETPWGIDDSGC